MAAWPAALIINFKFIYCAIFVWRIKMSATAPSRRTVVQLAATSIEPAKNFLRPGIHIRYCVTDLVSEAFGNLDYSSVWSCKTCIIQRVYQNRCTGYRLISKGSYPAYTKQAAFHLEGMVKGREGRRKLLFEKAYFVSDSSSYYLNPDDTALCFTAALYGKDDNLVGMSSMPPTWKACYSPTSAVWKWCCT